MELKRVFVETPRLLLRPLISEDSCALSVLGDDLQYWRRGYATESARALLAYAFDQLALDRVHAHPMLRNPASGAVLRKIGMQSAGVQRLRINKNGTFEDVAIYPVLRHEFAGDQATTNQEKVNDTLTTPAPHLGRPRGTARR